MKQEHFEKFKAVIQGMKQYWNQAPMGNYGLESYWDYLKKFSAGQFEIAAKHLIQTYKVRWNGDFPTALDFYDAIPNYIPEDQDKRNG